MMRYVLIKAIALLVFVAVVPSVYAAPYSDLEAVVVGASRAIRDQLVDEKAGHRTAVELLNRLRAGAYDGLSAPDELARKLSDDMQAISGDKHIGIVFDAESVARYRARENAQQSPEAQAIDAANKKKRAEAARLDNYGLRAVETMPGGIGYLRTDFFDGHVDDAKPVIAAAMNMLESSKAIILDLRRNSGGNSRILPLFMGYFLGPKPIHFATRIERWKNEETPLHTMIDEKGARHYDKPIYILTSGTTVSLAEHLTYHLRAFGRATIIGERTYGAGDGWDPLVLNDDFYLRMPRMRFINARTNRLFAEGQGITPDIITDAVIARRRAYVEALAYVAETATSKDEQAQVAWAQAVATARLQGVNPKDPAADSFAGDYGAYEFENRDGVLWLSFRGTPFVRLERLGPGLYLDDRSIPRQFQFNDGQSLTVILFEGDREAVTRR